MLQSATSMWKYCGLGGITLATLLLFGACSDSNVPSGPNPPAASSPPVEKLELVGLRLSAPEFHENGRFGLGLLATDKNDSAILSTSVTVGVNFDDSQFVASMAPTEAFEIVPKSLKPVVAAILLDNSGSMATSDPSEERGTAAKVFWESLLPENSQNVVGLFDFVDCGKFHTLQNFTRDNTLLNDGVGLISAIGGTPLYAATESTLNALNTNYSDVENERVLLVLTDGQPTCYGAENATVDLANSYGIPIYTVGLGPASDLSANSNATAVTLTQNLSLRTRGVYAAATQADALTPIFKSIARASSRGQLIAFFNITPVPAAGTVVKGTATFTSGSQTRSVAFSFVAPVAIPVSPSSSFEESDF